MPGSARTPRQELDGAATLQAPPPVRTPRRAEPTAGAGAGAAERDREPSPLVPVPAQRATTMSGTTTSSSKRDPGNFVPRSGPEWQVEPCSAADLERVAAFADAFPTDGDALLRRMQPYRARTALGAHGRVWDVHCWALPAAVNATTAPVALCMHGHGHSCCVTSWAAFFEPLHAAGFNIIALDAPCFGRSGGSERESGQANLWRADDTSLVLRLLSSFGVAPDSQRCAAFAQCMGGAMFLRALHAAPGFFGAFHVLSNTTIGSFPADIPDILRRKGGALLGYHELDPDHMREAVAYKALFALSAAEPKLCRLVDNARARTAGDPHVLDSNHLMVTSPGAGQLSRDPEGACFFFQPSEIVLQKIVGHVTRVAAPAISTAAFDSVAESAVALGQSDVNFAVTVRVRPPIGRESSQRRSYAVRPMELQGMTGGMVEEITLRTAAGKYISHPHHSLIPRERFERVVVISRWPGSREAVRVPPRVR